MKVVLAFDSFKGSLSAPDACALAQVALRAARPEIEAVVKPMADGGEGTAQAVMAARGGEWVPVTATGPLPRQRVQAGFVWFAEERRALVEMAAASGLTLLGAGERNPLLTTTGGTGELIRAALERGARHLWLAVGGSATTDGGVGAAMALGWTFLDAAGRPVGPGGAELERIARLVPPVRDWPAVEVLCDVDNPLCGEHGAARVYGPQKGATPEMVARLDAGLRHLGELVGAQLGVDILALPGAGAAGGLAGGAVAFMGARLISGIETLIRIGGLDRAVAGADWVITGEGAFDAQSLRGKAVSGIAGLARRSGARVAVIAGSVRVAPAEWRRHGIAAALALQAPGMSVDEAVARAPALLAERVREFARECLGG
jgi:glycerate 2-kinase